jgi:hypothetical protein
MKSHDLSEEGRMLMDAAQLNAARCCEKCSDPEFQSKSALTPNFPDPEFSAKNWGLTPVL